jgi:hypothetical protein
VSALPAPPACKAKFVFDGKALARLGAVGLTWEDEKGFTMTSDRSPLENRPGRRGLRLRVTSGSCARGRGPRIVPIRPTQMRSLPRGGQNVRQ